MNPAPAQANENSNGNVTAAKVAILEAEMGKLREATGQQWAKLAGHDTQMATVTTQLGTLTEQGREHRAELQACRAEFQDGLREIKATLAENPREQPGPDAPGKRGGVTLPWWVVLGLILAGAVAATPAALAGVLNWAASQAAQAGQ